MTFEELISANTAALVENNKLLTILTSAAKTNLPADKGGTAAPAPAKAPTTRGAAKDKPAKAPTAAAVTDDTKAFLDVEDETEYTERRAFVVKVCEKFGVKKMSELAEADRLPALAYLIDYKAGNATDLDDDDGRRDDSDVA